MRTLAVELNQFSSCPPTLADASGKQTKSISVPLKDLFHHYWMAKYGGTPPGGSFEFENQLTSGPEWRMKGDGIGADREAKRNISNELGKAFARWFAYEHLKHTYFCPFEVARNQPTSTGHTWVVEPGDLPDYVSGSSPSDINLLEAKGRYSSVSFKNAEFSSFRDQVQRASLIDSAGNAISVKGFISAARWATESTPKVKSTLFVEDPWTRGERKEIPRSVGGAMIRGHYSEVFRRLHIPELADSLAFGYPLAAKTIRVRTWRCGTGPLAGVEFVGGLIPPAHRSALYDFAWNSFGWSMPFLLPKLTFFGVTLDACRWALSTARQQAFEPNPLPEVLPIGKSHYLSTLRDGTVLGPSSYFDDLGSRDLE